MVHFGPSLDVRRVEVVNRWDEASNVESRFSGHHRGFEFSGSP